MKEADLIKAVDDALDKEIRVLAVYLLGSGARGELRKDSDIDLGLLLEPGEKMSPMERTGLANRLSYSLGRCADLELINSKNLVYAKEALFSGKQIYVRDKARAAMAAATLLGMYIRFNEDRKEVLDAYRAR